MTHGSSHPWQRIVQMVFGLQPHLTPGAHCHHCTFTVTTTTTVPTPPTSPTDMNHHQPTAGAAAGWGMAPPHAAPPLSALDTSVQSDHLVATRGVPQRCLLLLCTHMHTHAARATTTTTKPVKLPRRPHTHCQAPVQHVDAHQQTACPEEPPEQQQRLQQP